ncbi:hypothetical protein BHE74_00032298 [Ensete ventricosum]|nr:hypothetical protein BHE74_00032298 [Ensete ventricosum]
MNKDFANFKSIDYHNFIIISIGTGSAKIEHKFSAGLAAKWGIGKNLLKEPVSRANLETGVFEELDGEGTNADALTHLARRLSQERRLS